jgi:uncharacterized Zn finger protein
MEWETYGADHWFMWLRCGNCGHRMEVIVDNDRAAALDVLLDRQQAEIARAARAMEAERMSVEADKFISALRRDLIEADDFAR